MPQSIAGLIALKPGLAKDEVHGQRYNPAINWLPNTWKKLHVHRTCQPKTRLHLPISQSYTQTNSNILANPSCAGNTLRNEAIRCPTVNKCNTRGLCRPHCNRQFQ